MPPPPDGLWVGKIAHARKGQYAVSEIVNESLVIFVSFIGLDSEPPLHYCARALNHNG